MNREPSVFFGIPILVLLSSARSHDISSVLGVRLDGKPVVAKVAFATKGVDWCRVVVPNFLLFRIVADTHADVVVACPTASDVEGNVAGREV